MLRGRERERERARGVGGRKGNMEYYNKLNLHLHISFASSQRKLCNSTDFEFRKYCLETSLEVLEVYIT